MTQQDLWKQAAGEAAAALLTDGMIVGLGTGSTSKFAVDAIGKRVAAGLRIVGIPTSERTAEQARSLGIPLSTLGENPKIDVTIDGADEVQRGSLQLIKGLGGALLREKIVASSSAKLVIIVDETKWVDRLGARVVVPVEVVPFGWQSTDGKLRAIGANPKLRPGTDGGPYLTDGSHYILDCSFGGIEDPLKLQRDLDSVVGVVEHGLFLNMTSQVITGTADGVKTFRPGA